MTDKTVHKALRKTSWTLTEMNSSSSIMTACRKQMYMFNSMHLYISNYDADVTCEDCLKAIKDV